MVATSRARMQKRVDPHVDKTTPVVIKKYANRRLYNTETSAYVTLDDLAAMVRIERDFVVFDAKTGEDLTRAVLTQIIVDQESRPGSNAMLPIPFLRQLIRFYGDSIQCMVPSYLQLSLDTLAKEQERFRKDFAAAFSPQGAFEAYQEQARKNLVMFEQAIGMFTPFSGNGEGATEGGAERAATAPGTSSADPAPARTSTDAELAELKAQLASMQQKIEKLARQG
jgi:polyhydroxyalkanoate synthesis repressor PhaR